MRTEVRPDGATPSTGCRRPLVGTPTTHGDPPAATKPGVPAAIERIVEVTRTVEPGAAVTGFTVPAERSLVITDVVVSNLGATPSCGARVAAGTVSLDGDAANGGSGGPVTSAI